MEPNKSKFLWVFPIADISQPITLTNTQMRNNVPYILKLYLKSIFTTYCMLHTTNKHAFKVFRKFIDSVFLYKNKY